MDAAPPPPAPGPLDVRRLGLGRWRTDYQEAWDLQRALHSRRAAVGAQGDPAGRTDTLLLLEHPPVYTAGSRTEAHERPADGTPVVDVDRGGRVTFHGPGQLVGYPVVGLPEHVFVVDYLRRLEEALIRGVTDLGVACGRVPGRSGVWVAGGALPERKLAAIGVKVAGRVTMHGFALNCDVDLAWFSRFVPCGIADAGVSSLGAELGRDVGVVEAADAVEPHLRDLLAWEPWERSPDVERLTPVPLV